MIKDGSIMLNDLNNFPINHETHGPSWYARPARFHFPGEISFYAFGFEKGRHLAKKMVRSLGVQRWET